MYLALQSFPIFQLLQLDTQSLMLYNLISSDNSNDGAECKLIFIFAFVIHFILLCSAKHSYYYTELSTIHVLQHHIDGRYRNQTKLQNPFTPIEVHLHILFAIKVTSILPTDNNSDKSYKTNT